MNKRGFEGRVITKVTKQIQKTFIDPSSPQRSNIEKESAIPIYERILLTDAK